MLRLPIFICIVVLIAGSSAAQNTPDEPKAQTFSLAAANQFMDRAARDWTTSRKCFACHTNYVYLIAKPGSESGQADEAHREVRGELEKLVEERWEKSGPRWDAEVVMSAAVLAMNDRATSGKLHATTRKALDRMWTVQREDGGFDWLKCGWPPMESDDDYGIAIAALAAAAAPEDYQTTPAAQAGLAKLKSYLVKNPAPTLHHEAMLLWPEAYGVKLLSEQARASTIAKLIALQKSDGGWNSATLGDWKRGDGKEQDKETSDGYGTGFVVFILQQSASGKSTPAEPSADPSADPSSAISRGQAWLKSNQRASGRWHTRSLNKDSQHFLSHAGTAFAIMALK